MREAWSEIRPRAARCDNARERWTLVVIGLASIYEGLVEVLSLGYLTTHVRGWVLFDFLDRED